MLVVDPVVLGGFGSFWVVLARFGWFWLVPCFSNYDIFRGVVWISFSKYCVEGAQT